MRTSAPRRTSSLTNMNRPSNTFSVISAVPVETAASATAIGCRSVGNPGKGSVTTSTQRGRSSIATRMPSGSDLHRRAGVGELVQRDGQVVGDGPLDDDVAAGHDRADRPGAGDDPVGHGRVGRPGERASTPSTVIVEVPAPSMRAPIALSIVQRSTISGSRAALSMTVVPLGQDGRHHQVLGRADRREVQPDRRAGQPGRGGDEEAVLADDRRAEPLQAGDVHVQAAGADGVAAGQRHLARCRSGRPAGRGR